MKHGVTVKMKCGAAVKPALLVMAVLLLGACQQNAIFDTISKETPPIKPLIPGNPTNMVVFKERLYAGQGDSLHSYKSTEGWGHSIGNPGGSMYGHALAATENNLYAAASDKLRIYDASGEWKSELGNGNSSIQSVFSATDSNGKWFVFAGKQINSTTYEVYYLNDASPSSLIPLPSGAGMLTGAACNGTTWYVSTDNGIYYFTSPSDTLTSAGTILSETNIKGIIRTGSSTVVAVDTAGKFYEINTNAVEKGNVGGGSRARTAFTVWESPVAGAGSLLLVGVEGGSYGNGYREIRLDSSGSTGAVQDPGGESPTTVADNGAYKSSLRNHPVNYLLQVPASVHPDRILFASTVGEGLWSNRSGKWEAEH